jgi:hypothetical protein
MQRVSAKAACLPCAAVLAPGELAEYNTVQVR